jgi:hypothetical protein
MYPFSSGEQCTMLTLVQLGLQVNQFQVPDAQEPSPITCISKNPAGKSNAQAISIVAILAKVNPVSLYFLQKIKRVLKFV